MATILLEIPISLKIVPDAFVQRLAELRQDQVADLFPNTIRRLGDLAKVGQVLWQDRATKIPGAEGRPLRLGTSASDPMVRLDRTAYANSVQLAPGQESELSAIIFSDDPQAKVIEEGGAEIDLHAVLAYAPKARQGKKGKYLHIPFRHATTEPGGRSGKRFQYLIPPSSSNVLPAQVLAVMRRKRPWLITGHRMEPGANVPMVQRNIYTKRPGRLSAGELQALKHNPDSPEGRRLIGLMRAGKKGHRQYLTIRTLSESNKEGWRIPAYSAQRVRDAVKADLDKLVPGWFDDAIRADAQSWLDGVSGQYDSIHF